MLRVPSKKGRKAEKVNRILFEKDEITDGTVTFSDIRAEHILKVLHGEVGQILKTGEVDGLLGTGEITAIENETVTVKLTHDTPSPQPWIDLILAPPRPRALKRLLPQLASLGVGRIVLVGANKVEKDFWGATLLKEENYRPLFIEGLMQAGTTILPRLEVRRNYRKFLREELNAAFPTRLRIVAHPGAAGQKECSLHPKERPVLAVGPEGGWTDSEVAELEAAGFTRYSLGSRILRTDTALIALLAQLQLLTENL